MAAQANVAAHEASIAAYKRFMNDLGADEVVKFAGADHPDYQSRTSYVWVRNGDKVAVRRTIWCKRPR